MLSEGQVTKFYDRTLGKVVVGFAEMLDELKHPSITTLKKINHPNFTANVHSLLEQIDCIGTATLDQVLHPSSNYDSVRMSEYEGFILTSIADSEKYDVRPSKAVTEYTKSMLPCISLSGSFRRTPFDANIVYRPDPRFGSVERARDDICKMTERIFQVLKE